MTREQRHTLARLKTAEEVRAEFVRAGITYTAWAKQHGYSRGLVVQVLSGRLKGAYGKSHEVAVALGMKDGQIVDPAAFRAPKG